MISPENFEAKTGFAAIRSLVSDSCLSTLGKSWCNEMQFSSDFETVHRNLRCTDEMVRILSSTKTLPLQNIHDITPHLKRIKAQGSYLDADVLRQLRSTLVTIDSLAVFFRASDSESSRPLFPELKEAFSPMQAFPAIISAINGVLNQHGGIIDNASPELNSIRRSMQSVTSSMSGLMRRVIERSISNGTLERDATPSIRDGRLVLPVPAMMKRQLNGIVHDESSTGKTVFIEPAEVVEANNRLRELQAQEHREIIRILVQLADFIRPSLDELLQTMNILGLFDFIRAKALVAIRFNAAMPNLEQSRQIEWYHAIHPVLEMSLKAQGREVVPLDIHLYDKQRILVISGPNAGGKSVTLKTVGCIQYMLQCGMLPTIYSNSHVSVFQDILLDIGDEQSIENDLSTYSSHLRNMKRFMLSASPASLILIDEMGSGTEPHFGGALAQSILSQLNSSKVMGIVTTHYQNLKSFADSTDGVVNGAMLYDRQHMRPLFQLSVGSPGSSFALEIARNTGLPKQVIDEAKRLVGSDYVDSDKYMLDIARDRRYWANKRLSIKEKEHKLESVLQSYEQRLDELRQRKSSIIADARRQAADLLKDSNAALEKTILEIRKNQAEKERTKEVRRELEEYKRHLEDDSSDGHISQIKPLNHKSKKRHNDKLKSNLSTKREIKSGDAVKMIDGNTAGIVLSVDGNKATVAFGSLRTIVNADKLRLTSSSAAKSKVSKSVVPLSIADSSRERRLNFSHELDVRGMRVDEALQAVTYFLDDALQFGIRQVRILHGTGTGALRSSIRQFLQTYQPVNQFHDEDVRFGGAGITIVHME